MKGATPRGADAETDLAAAKPLTHRRGRVGIVVS